VVTCQDPATLTCTEEKTTRWLCSDESGYKVECRGKTARRAAIEYCEEHERAEKSYQVAVRCTRLNKRGHSTDEHERVVVTIDPHVPTCDDRRDEITQRDNDGHDWRSPIWLGGLESNPGVSGNGGGVRIKTVCRCCGAYKRVDTWDTNAWGETFESVCYDKADDESEEWLAGIWGGATC
jgi:hypothetical protein